MISPIPVVSVILTVYNRERFVTEAIESVLAQTLADFELIIVDDGSVDNSPQIIADYARRDSRIFIITQKNAGLSAARNAGAKKARADLLAFMDDDDHSLPTRLEKQVAFLRSHLQVDCCIQCVSLMDEFGKLIRTARLPRPLPIIFFAASNSAAAYLAGGTAMTRRGAFWEIGGFREYFQIMEEMDFTLRFVQSHRSIGVVVEDLYRQRIYRGARNKTNLTGGCPFLQFKYTAAAIISAHYRCAGKDDPIEKNVPLDEIMKSLVDLPEDARIYLIRYARNAARRILRDGTRRIESLIEFWNAVGYISEMSVGLKRRTHSAFRWLLWQAMRYGRFSIAAGLIKNFTGRIVQNSSW